MTQQKLTKEWQQAVARRITSALSAKNNLYSKAILDLKKAEFYETEDGQAILQLQEKFNQPCSTRILTFQESSYFYVQPFPMPVSTEVQDKLVLTHYKRTDLSLPALSEHIEEEYLKKQKDFYLKKYNFSLE